MWQMTSEWKILMKLTKGTFCLESPGKFLGSRVLATGWSRYWKRRFFFFSPYQSKNMNVNNYMSNIYTCIYKGHWLKWKVELMAFEVAWSASLFDKLSLIPAKLHCYCVIDIDYFYLFFLHLSSIVELFVTSIFNTSKNIPCTMYVTFAKNILA